MCKNLVGQLVVKEGREETSNHEEGSYILKSLSTDVFEPRTSAGSRNFSSSTRITPFPLKMLSCKC